MCYLNVSLIDLFVRFLKAQSELPVFSSDVDEKRNYSVRISRTRLWENLIRDSIKVSKDMYTHTRIQYIEPFLKVEQAQKLRILHKASCELANENRIVSQIKSIGFRRKQSVASRTKVQTFTLYLYMSICYLRYK